MTVCFIADNPETTRHPVIGAVLERLSASAAESAYAGQKMARLGLVAMALCRPIELRPEEAPSLSGLVSGLLKPRADG